MGTIDRLSCHMKLKPQSKILLFSLAFVVTFATGVKQGMYVQNQNTKQEKIIEANKLKLIPSPTPNTRFQVVTNSQCNVQYLLPDYIATNSAKVLMKCEGPDFDEQKVQAEGYTRLPLRIDNPYQNVWVKTTPELNKLITNSISALSP